MEDLELSLVRAYGRDDLPERIRRAAAALAPQPGLPPRPEDLAGLDELHMGGRAATRALADGLALRPEMTVLDIGCGLGGAARLFAADHGCRVVGLDLTPAFVAAAELLTELVGLHTLVRFRTGSATRLPFPHGQFDVVTLLHVGMNIPDKGQLCTEAARVLKPDGRFAVYDVMQVGDRPPTYPVAWADGPDTSFLAARADYRRALAAAGLVVESERDRTDLALGQVRRLHDRLVRGAPPPGPAILMGEAAAAKVGNMLDGLGRGLIAPVEIIARRA